MKKCYIAGKIGDLPEAEYKANFEEGKKDVRELGYEPVSPVDLPHEHGRTWSEYMKEDISEMCKCDYVYALRNWTQSRGAKIEVKLAMKLGLTIIHQSTFVSNGIHNS